MYSVRKFPTVDKDDWISANREMIDVELSKYEGLFNEEQVKVAFENLITEYLYVQSVLENVTDWRNNFLRCIADIMSSAEEAIAHRGAIELQNGRLMVIRKVLEWF